jgi:hypothetical protein
MVVLVENFPTNTQAEKRENLFHRFKPCSVRQDAEAKKAAPQSRAKGCVFRATLLDRGSKGSGRRAAWE